MSEAQKYQRKKNILIITFMVLLVVFILIMCGIFIYAKMNPPREFVSQDEIEIKQIKSLEYRLADKPKYIVIKDQMEFRVTENDNELKLVLTGDKQIKLSKEQEEIDVEILYDEVNINSNVKSIYQNPEVSLILTESGILYKLVDNEVKDGKLNVEEVLTEIKEIVQLIQITDSVYVLNSDNNLISIDTEEEYNGIIDIIQTATSNIYIYENYLFGLEEGKVFVDENNAPLRINLSFDNKIIGEDNIIYEINTTDNTLSTSKLGVFNKVGYKKEEGKNIYKISLDANTGIYDFETNYYYTR